MGDLVQTFNDRRNAQIKNERSVEIIQQTARTKGINILERYKETLKSDIAIALMIEVQRPIFGDHTTDHFLRRLYEFREYYAVQPNNYDASSVLENIVAELSRNKGDMPAPVGRIFDLLLQNCDHHALAEGTQMFAHDKKMSEAQNTSNAIQFFQAWSQEDDAKEVLDCLRYVMSKGSVRDVADRFATKFISRFVNVSMAHIRLNTTQAIASSQKRHARSMLEARGMRNNLELVISN